MIRLLFRLFVVGIVLSEQRSGESIALSFTANVLSGMSILPQDIQIETVSVYSRFVSLPLETAGKNEETPLR